MVFVLSVLNRVQYIISRKSVPNNGHDLCQSVLIINSALGHKQSTKIEGVVLNRVCILGIFCPKQGQGFKSSIPKYWSSIPPGTVIYFELCHFKQDCEVRV